MMFIGCSLDVHRSCSACSFANPLSKQEVMLSIQEAKTVFINSFLRILPEWSRRRLFWVSCLRNSNNEIWSKSWSSRHSVAANLQESPSILKHPQEPQSMRFFCKSKDLNFRTSQVRSSHVMWQANGYEGDIQEICSDQLQSCEYTNSPLEGSLSTRSTRCMCTCMISWVQGYILHSDSNEFSIVWLKQWPSFSACSEVQTLNFRLPNWLNQRLTSN